MMRYYLLTTLLLLHSFAIAQSNRADSLRAMLLDGGKNSHVMVFAHRGDWRNSPAENSLIAFRKCIDAGIDGIEVDVQMTRDSVLIVMHDETLDRTTTGKGMVKDYTLQEIKKLYLRSPIGVITRQKIPTLEEVFDLAKGRILIQIDKWQNVREQVLALARKKDCLSQIIMRSSFSHSQFMDKVGKLPEEVIYIPVLVSKGKKDGAKLEDFIKNFPVPIASFSFTDDKAEILDSIPSLKKRGYRIWMNSLWETFNGGHDDELATTDIANSYQWLLDQGANIIFSDNPMLLLTYLQKTNRRQL